MSSHQGNNSNSTTSVGITLNIHLPNASSTTTRTSPISQVDDNYVVPEVAGKFDTSTKSSNTLAVPPDMHQEILARLESLEQQDTVSTDQIKNLKDALQVEKENNVRRKKDHEDVEMKLQVEREEHHLLSQKYREIQVRMEELGNKLGELESKQERSEDNPKINLPYMEEIESCLMEKLQQKIEEDKEDVEKEINKRLLSIKNATQDAISQIRRCKVDTKKEDIKLSLWYQSIEKAKKDSLGVIKREKQDSEEVKNRRLS